MSPFDLPTRTYLLPPGTAAGRVLGQLADRVPPPLVTVAGPVRVVTWTALDTADRRLRAAGLELGWETVPAPGRLVLREAGTTWTVPVGLGRSARGYRLAELPDEGLRARLTAVVDVRALLPLIELRRREHPVEVHNRDAKIVVRLRFDDLWATPGTDPRALPGRVEVNGVLGYGKAFARIDEVLRGRLALEPACTAVVDDGVAAVGQRLGAMALGPPSPVELAADEPAGKATVQVLRHLAGTVEANLPGALDDIDPEFLHDLRVAVRRSRSVLREMKAVFPAGARRPQADALRWIQTVTGPTRDLDVQLLEWDELVSQLPPGHHDDVAIARELLVARRAAAFRRMRTTLRGPQYRQRWSAWREFLDHQPATGGDAGPDAARPIRRVAGRRIAVVYRRMVRDGRRIDDGAPAEALHDLRKRGKELRYLLELFGGVFPPRRVRPLVVSLKALQDVLGRHQDREIQAANLRALAPELAVRDGGADAVLALGALVDRLRVEQAEARARFAGRFAAFAGLKVPT